MTSARPALTASAVALYNKNSAAVLRVVRRLGVAEADVEDVAHDVFIVAFRRLAELSPSPNTKAWLFAIARRVAADYRKRAFRHKECLTEAIDEFSGAQQQTPIDALELTRGRSALKYALSELDDEKREVFVLYEFGGLTMREVADAVGCPLQTGYSRLRAGRERVFALVRRRVLERARTNDAASTASVRRLAVALGLASIAAESAASAGVAVTTISVAGKVTAAAVAAFTCAAVAAVALSSQSERTPIAVPAVAQVAPPALPPSPAVSTSPESDEVPLQRSVPTTLKTPKARAKEKGRQNTSTVVPPIVPPHRATLGEESRLLLSAQRSLAGDPTQTLRILARHRKRFPRGELAEERDALAILANRDLGRSNETRHLTDELNTAYPDSAYQEPPLP